jgi:hypothetical protein
VVFFSESESVYVLLFFVYICIGVGDLIVGRGGDGDPMGGLAPP